MMKELIFDNKIYVLLKSFDYVVRSDETLYNKKVTSLFLRDSHSISGHCSSLPQLHPKEQRNGGKPKEGNLQPEGTFRW